MTTSHFLSRRVRRGLAIGGALLFGGGFAAHAGLIVIEQAQQRAEREARGGAHAADGAPNPAATETPAPAQGATGTIALPAVPADLAALFVGTSTSPASLAATIKPARPFSLSGASADAIGRAQQCLTAAIYYEAASESEAGQRAVAQVVLNRVRHPAFPASVCGVVYQGSERGSGCQFSFACDGSMNRARNAAAWARAARYAYDALNGFVMDQVGEATHYHTYAVNPSWNRSLVMTAAIGAHFFQRWHGAWGTPAAFRQPYARVEPLPGPKPRSGGGQLAVSGLPGMMSTMLSTVVAGPARSPAASVAPPPPPPTDVRPEFADSGRARDPAVDSGVVPSAKPTAATTLPETTMRDEFADTGKPIQPAR